MHLDEEPDDDVTIDLMNSDSGHLTASPSSITFTKEGEASDPNKWVWNAPQTVTLTAVTDSDASDEIVTITHVADIGGKDYVLAQVRAVVRDSALPALTLEQQNRDISEITVAEGGTATYTVKPASAPSSDLTVTPALILTNTDNEIIASFVDTIAVVPASLIFTAGTNGNWETPQTMTVTGLPDDDEFDDPAVIWHVARHDGEDYIMGRLPVTVTDGNRAPYFEEGLDTTREVPETAGQGTSVGDPVTALDLNTGDTLTYSLDDPGPKFDINSATSQVTVAANNSLDYETEPDHEVKVTVTDPGGLSDTIYVKVIITGVNEPPVINGLSAPEFNENATGRITRYTATDPERDSFTWSVAGVNVSDFSIDSRGYFSINKPLNYETKSTYNVAIVATDDADPPDAGEFPVTVVVKDVNESPEIFLVGATHDYAENGVHPVQQYFARDPEGDTPINWSLSGADGGDISITNTGLLQFRQTPDYERPTDSNHDNIYRFTVRASDGRLTGTKDVTVTLETSTKRRQSQAMPPSPTRRTPPLPGYSTATPPPTPNEARSPGPSMATMGTISP